MISLQLGARVSLDEREIPVVSRTEERLGHGFFDSSLLHLLEIFRSSKLNPYNFAHAQQLT